MMSSTRGNVIALVIASALASFRVSATAATTATFRTTARYLDKGSTYGLKQTRDGDNTHADISIVFGNGGDGDTATSLVIDDELDQMWEDGSESEEKCGEQCVDNPDFVSMMGLPCHGHSYFVCGMFAQVGFTEEQVSELIRNCPCSCEACPKPEPSSNTMAASKTTTSRPSAAQVSSTPTSRPSAAPDVTSNPTTKSPSNALSPITPGINVTDRIGFPEDAEGDAADDMENNVLGPLSLKELIIISAGGGCLVLFIGLSVFSIARNKSSTKEKESQNKQGETQHDSGKSSSSTIETDDNSPSVEYYTYINKATKNNRGVTNFSTSQQAWSTKRDFLAEKRSQKSLRNASQREDNFADAQETGTVTASMRGDNETLICLPEDECATEMACNGEESVLLAQEVGRVLCLDTVGTEMAYNGSKAGKSSDSGGVYYL